MFQERQIYNKRVLWGWDRDDFTVGNNEGIIKIGDWKMGIRICFEIRFPEFFRELYIKQTDLNIVIFYDVSGHDDISPFSPFQTAPTILCDKSGQVLNELVRNEEKLLTYHLEKKENNFGETGRKEIADWLCQM